MLKFADSGYFVHIFAEELLTDKLLHNRCVRLSDLGGLCLQLPAMVNAIGSLDVLFKAFGCDLFLDDVRNDNILGIRRRWN